MQETIKPLKLTVANGKQAWSRGGELGSGRAAVQACKWLQFDVVTCPITTLAFFFPDFDLCSVPRANLSITRPPGHSNVLKLGGFGCTPPSGCLLASPTHHPCRGAPATKMASPRDTPRPQAEIYLSLPA